MSSLEQLRADLERMSIEIAGLRGELAACDLTIQDLRRRLAASGALGQTIDTLRSELAAIRGKSARPATGERCPRCHYTAPNASNGCALCNPERLGERLEEALEDVRERDERIEKLEESIRKGHGEP